MSNGHRQSNGRGRLGAGAPLEYDLVLGKIPAWRRDGSVPAVIYCHGANGSLGSVWYDTNERPFLDSLAEHFTVFVADFGGNSFGSDSAIDLVSSAVSYLESKWGINKKVLLAGNSMGALTSLNYTLMHPNKVAAVAMAIPALDLNDIVANNRLGMAAVINTIYSGAYNNTTHGPTHNPVVYANDLPESLPIGLWTSSNDPTTVPSTVTAFLSARPQTLRTNIGAVGHSTASITTNTCKQMLEFLITHQP